MMMSSVPAAELSAMKKWVMIGVAPVKVNVIALSFSSMSVVARFWNVTAWRA